MSEQDLFTPDQAAKFKGVSRTAVYSAIAEGRLKATRILGRLAVKKSDLLAWTPVRYSGRPKGIPMSAGAKARLSTSQKHRWKQRKHSSRHD